MSVDKTNVTSATFTFSAKPELLVGGVKQPFKDMEIGGKTIQGVRLKDGSIARLSQRKSDQLWEVTLTAYKGKSLAERSIRVGEGGHISRLRTDKNDVYKLKNDRTLYSGKAIKLNDEMFKKLTAGRSPIKPSPPRIEIRPEVPKKEKEDDRQDIVLTEPPPTLRRRNARAGLDDLPYQHVQIQIPKPGQKEKED